jgi:phage terminase large subunit
VPFAERIKTIIDPSAASFITLLKKRGKYHVLPAKNDVADGIRETATAMKQGLIKISPVCTNWIKEVQGYVWDDSAADDRPVKIDDHAMDDSRYFVKTLKIARPKATYTPMFM